MRHLTHKEIISLVAMCLGVAMLLLAGVSISHNHAIISSANPASQTAFTFGTCSFFSCGHSAPPPPSCDVWPLSQTIVAGQSATFAYSCAHGGQFFVYGGGYDSRVPGEWRVYQTTAEATVDPENAGNTLYTYTPVFVYDPGSGSWIQPYTVVPAGPRDGGDPSAVCSGMESYISPTNGTYGGPTACYAGGWYSGGGTFTVTPSVSTTYIAFDPAFQFGSGSLRSYFSVGVTVVNPGPPTPATMSISADAPIIKLGQSTTIRATFALGAGDFLLDTDIDEVPPNGTGFNAAITGTALGGAPANPLTFTFTPTQTGAYIFGPNVVTGNYNAWQTISRDQWASVVVIAADGTVPSDGTTPGITPGTTPGTGSCIGAHQFGTQPNCSCDFGFVMQGGSCVPSTCSDSHAVPPLCTTCVANYTYQNGSCINIPTLSLSANPTRVHNGSPTTISWSVTGLASDSDVACTIRSNPAGVFSQSMPVGTSPTWSGSEPTTAISHAADITLSCSNSAPKTISVTLIPDVIEK